MISVVINTHNRKADLLVAIKSVQRQTYQPSEVIVVDDCSSDGTENIDFESLGVRYIRNSNNKGLAKSRQIGLDATGNEFVSFLDDDDFFSDDDKLKFQVGAIEEDSNIAVVCTNVIEFDGINLPKEKKVQWPENIKKHFLHRNGIIYPSTTLIRKSAFNAVGGFDSRFPRGIDSDVYRRLIFSGYKIKHIPISTVNYRIGRKDKITDNISKEGLRKDIDSNVLTLRKYLKHYLFSPVVLAKKIVLISKKTIRLIVQ
ncbi:glycosyltransferase [Vibrio alginolyticus]|nr:glycosyltransferase [Vibrio alginolyticus]